MENDLIVEMVWYAGVLFVKIIKILKHQINDQNKYMSQKKYDIV